MQRLLPAMQQAAQPEDRTLLPNQAPALPAARAGTGAAPAAAPTAAAQTAKVRGKPCLTLLRWASC